MPYMIRRESDDSIMPGWYGTKEFAFKDLDKFYSTPGGYVVIEFCNVPVERPREYMVLFHNEGADLKYDPRIRRWMRNCDGTTQSAYHTFSEALDSLNTCMAAHGNGMIVRVVESENREQGNSG